MKHLKSCRPQSGRLYPVGEYTTREICSCVYNKNRAKYDRIYREYRRHLDAVAESRAVLLCILQTRFSFLSQQLRLSLAWRYQAPYNGALLYSAAAATADGRRQEKQKKDPSSLKKRIGEENARLFRAFLASLIFMATLKHYLLYSLFL